MALLDVVENKIWDPAGGSKSWGVLWKDISCLLCCEVNALLCDMLPDTMLCLTMGPETMESSDHGLKPPKL
jgi:hypothetical protein